MKHMKRSMIGVAATALAAGAVLVSAMPASAVSGQHVSLHTWSAYHYADSFGAIQHYNVLTDNTVHTGNWAAPANWSNQAVCWANVSVSSYFSRA